MPEHEFIDRPVLRGTWLYDGRIAQRVEIVACDYDRFHARDLDDMPYSGETLEEIGDPRPMGPDAVLYHVRATGSPDFDTLAEARAWADAQPWGPVTWDA